MDLCRETVWDTPNDGTQYAKLEEADCVYDFLAGLNPKFDTVCSRILGQRPLPPLMELCFEVHLEEDRTNAMGVLTTLTIDSAVFSARSSNHDSDKNNGKSIPVCKKRSSSEKQNSGRAYISETTPASTSQSTGPTASQTKIPTLGAIAQSGMPQSFGLISVDGKNLWSLDSRATDHLTGSSKHFISCAPCADKSEVSSIFQNFYHTIETQFHTKIAILRSDNGRKFQNHNLSESLASKGIVHQTLCADTPQLANRKNRQLVEVARSLMLSTSLSSYLWGDAILTAAHLINRMSSRILHLQTPLDCLKESYPSTRFVFEVPLRVYGCTAYVHNFSPNQTKFTYRAQAYVFVGYPFHQHGYKCFHPPSRKYFVTMDVTFYENRPYFPVSHLQGRVFDVAVLENVEEKNRGDETERKGTRSCTKHPICNYVSYDNLSPQFRAFTASLDSTIIPKNIYTTLECPEWKNAVMEEMKALENNRTWEICGLPKGHKTVGCKQVFSPKYKADGMFDRHKTRLVGKGFTQTYGIDYSETFSPVAKLNTVRVQDLGNLKYFLGMEVARFKEGISVSERKYTLDLLTETGMLGCRPADTPIEFNCKLGNFDDQVPVDKEQYQRLVATISIANDTVQHDRTKHFEIDWHFIKERLDRGSICIPYIPSSQQVADVLTKGLLRPHIDLCVSKLELIDITSQLEGEC
ncbi:reverse transcriptase [Cucumis melo var. makuwa]|uniref:Reverse transcriptase n=1 Tax=Cucumis melo var. makuwa TaxID=1194695 RepID=A0A5D3D416_CUCMM|nr:reverse transcriptase [Cucumis melo var. makuwa]TYK18287.1 reverse transcriptase [Cucumis melo var. makuwa]